MAYKLIVYTGITVLIHNMGDPHEHYLIHKLEMVKNYMVFSLQIDHGKEMTM